MNIPDAALRYAERGLPVFPVRGKLPLTDHGFKDASTSAETIRAWWSQWPDANVAIPTGPVSGLVVLDVDPRHEGGKSLAALEEKHGPLPLTLEARTGGGGRHLFFALGNGENVRNSAGRLGPGLDVRGDGGYIVAPPSIHPETKQLYVWTNKTKPAQAPAWLIQESCAPPATYESVSSAPIPTGQRNDTLTRIGGAMRRKGCTPEAIEAALLAENTRRCNPPLPEQEARAIAQSVSRYAPSAVVGKGKPQSGFRLTSLRDLMLEPEEHISWLLADKLPAGGLSVLSAKPKVGKSTFARCLALAVATGEPFLDCATTKGPVIYLALEEKRGEVRRHFSDLGATGDEEIYIHAASAPQEAVLELCQVTRQKRPVLIVIDPLFKFVRIRDEKAYAEVCNAIEPLLTLARESGAHVLLSHHSGKMERADATDSILGSTAIFGGVDSAIILKKADRYRTVQSCQRYGADWPELVLNFDPAERSLSLGVERFEAEAGRISEAIAAYLAGCDEPQTRVQIEAGVQGNTKHKRAALKALCAAGRVSESGAGAKGDPFRYTLKPNTDSQAGNERKPFVDSCSHVYAGTSKQQSENGAETRMNIGDILVPSVSRDPQKVVDSEEQGFLEGKL